MAIIKLGSMASDARGSLGGTTFSRNRFGAYVRQRVVPVNPATPPQENVRIAMNQLQNRFRATLTQAQKDAWKNYANETPTLNKLGDSILLTAINMYLRANIVYVLAGKSPIDDAPATPGIAAIPDLTFTGTSAGGIVLAEPSPTLGTDDVLQVQLSPPKPFSVNFFKGPFNLTSYHDDTETWPVTLLAAASVSIGQRYFAQARVVRADGATSNKFLYRIDVTT